MIVKFPDLNTLQLALTAGAVPANVACREAIAGFGERDQLWVETSAKLSTTARKELNRLGALVCKSSDAALRISVSCWPELLPLVRDEPPLDDLEKMPVLFDVASGEELSRLVLEMLRLGNDRQSFRWLEASSRRTRALLRVLGPPYYSLLRAIDRPNETDAMPRAFMERAAGVWVEWGYTHPLIENIRPPKGQILLLQPPRQWTAIPDAPFRDVYEIVEFHLPDTAVHWQDHPLSTRIQVAPRLRQAGPAEGAELWVLRGEAVEALHRFVENAEDQLLTRLAFAVAEKGGQTIVALRVRPSKLPLPMLALPAEEYKSYLRLSNLFLPVGMALHPPLRRDVVRKLLAEDLSRITWLARGDNGAFKAESLPEEAFRPLTDWVEYVLDCNKDALQAWVQAAQFAFESFICDEDAPKSPRRPPEKDRTAADRERGTQPLAHARGSQDETAASEPREEIAEDAAEESNLEALSIAEPIEPSALEQERRAAEEKFLSLPGTLDDEAHRALWPRLAELNARLGQREDAVLCWLHALWEAVPSADSSKKWAAAWLRAESRSKREMSGEDLDHLLQQAEPATADVRILAASLVGASQRNPPPSALLHRLQAIGRFLETHENLLPARACWLAWVHWVELSGGDVLALARARDRLLERLFQNGLRPEQDLPSFLRFAGQPARQQFQDAGPWLESVCARARSWIKDNVDPFENRALTGAYVELYFAFGMACLGDADRSRGLLRQAQEALSGTSVVHDFLLFAFEFRIQAALAGKPHLGSLPPNLLAELEQMGELDRYVIESLQHNSRILEPDRQVNPYRHRIAHTSDLERELVELSDLTDRQQIQNRLRKLLAESPRGRAGDEVRARILRTALEIAPRAGEDLAREMLERALPVFDAQPEPSARDRLEAQAKFLQHALFAAAHFGRAEHIHPLVGRFRQLLHAGRNLGVLQDVCTLAEQCFRSLRKLGMRPEIDGLLAETADLVLQGRDIAALVRSLNFRTNSPAPLIALLHAAAGWLYFGRSERAEPILQAVREVLFRAEFGQPRQRRDLACAYARTVGQTTPTVARDRLEEIFDRLKNYRGLTTTSSHFSILQLDLIEAVVLAVIGEDFGRGGQASRWLDEEEFLVRRRIHEDHRRRVSSVSVAGASG